MSDTLQTLLERAKNWPDAAREELFRLGLEIEADLQGDYIPTPAELAGLARGLADALAGKFASDDEMARAFAKFKGA